MQFSLGDPVTQIPGVNEQRTRALERLGITTIGELIKHTPHRYEYQHGLTPIGQLPLEVGVTTCGCVHSCRWVPQRGSYGGRSRGAKGRFLSSIVDDTGRLDLVFFNAAYLRDQIHPGQWLAVTGKVTRYQDARQMVNPQLRLLDVPPDSTSHDSIATDDAKYRPIYPASEQLTSEQIERIITGILPAVVNQIEDHLSEVFRKERNLFSLEESYRILHQPSDEEQVRQALRRLAYDELLQLQLGFAMKRKYTKTKVLAPALRWSQAIDEHICRRFPFDLTEDQRNVIRELIEDLQQPRPMNRLLQGDVGSGKTVVALYALLMAVASNKQGALLAPTELLAEQHYASIAQMLERSNVRMAILTGSLSESQRTAALDRVRRGQIDLLIGTHSILTESVRFKQLAVVVIDEQHRFGVMQRATARSKSERADHAPHTLVMTATPIPRTLGLGLFGDLDLSTIRHPPPGRKPIVTRVTPSHQADEVYDYAARRIAKGEQAFVVLPAIEDHRSSLKTVRSHAQHLAQTHFQNFRVATIHGRLKPATRERIMDRFRSGLIDVLVATTVVEVGVDIPNAGVMIVEHAERFGLAQLHQLRGRVGRGTRKSLCVFLADAETDDAQRRMKAIESTCDGFQIAEADLSIRGMGEFFGTKQSGLPPLKYADFTKHADLLNLARRDAVQIVEQDPRLQDASNELLRKRMMKSFGQAIGLGDVA